MQDIRHQSTDNIRYQPEEKTQNNQNSKAMTVYPDICFE